MDLFDVSDFDHFRRRPSPVSFGIVWRQHCTNTQNQSYLVKLYGKQHCLQIGWVCATVEWVNIPVSLLIVFFLPLSILYGCQTEIYYDAVAVRMKVIASNLPFKRKRLGNFISVQFTNILF